MLKINEEWPAFVRSLMAEQGISERRLCVIANIPRSSFRLFLAGAAPMISVSLIERTLNALGYELQPVQRKDQ